ncbi:MAG: DUF1289 domain-containing protein [Thermodesulfovibrionales bacterium]|jgi:predicted Fe-S protein YdhL (DUF1289 family)
MRKSEKNVKKDEVKSPCVKRCSLGRNKVCTGCYRTSDEIVAWPDADDRMRIKILEATAFRRAQLND